MIGVAVSTTKRPHTQTLPAALVAWEEHAPPGTVFVVNRDKTRCGTAWAKNRGIADLMAAGCDHLFLADDDCWPTTGDWWQPYVEDPEPHLMLCWGRSRRLTTDGHYTTWRWPRGVMLYAEARVIETVGGMRPEFCATGGGEHVEWSRRIHNAGLTSHPFTDLTCSPLLWHAEDWGHDGETNHHLGARRAGNTTMDRDAHANARYALFEQHRSSSDYVPYC